MSVEMLCVGCGRSTPVHVSAADLYRTGVCVVRCEKCSLAFHEAFDRWQASRMGKAPDDFDLEQIDDGYAAEMAKQRRTTVKYREGR